MMKQFSTKSPWIANPIIETAFIILPPFLCVLIVFLFPNVFATQNKMPELWWLALVVFIDVAHVYSTLYRTYFHNTEAKKHRRILILIPIFSFIASFAVYAFSPVFFWRLLAYIAVYHFIRQQYGFMRIYGKNDRLSKWQNSFDNYIIYLATIYPIIYWHLSDSRNFHWFVEGDFVLFHLPVFLTLTSFLYYISIVLYLIKEIYNFLIKQFNAPKVLIVLGTILSWYFGIIYFNGDMSFTLLNVVSHGIPYMALVWLYATKENSKEKTKIQKVISKPYGIFFFLSFIIFLAFIEEGLWDFFVWKEHKDVFSIFENFSFPDPSLTILVPLLTLPQLTHYIIDGYIWKRNKLSASFEFLK